MICEKCKKEHNGSFGSGRFCSRNCANTRTHSRETKSKISKSIKNSDLYRINNSKVDRTKTEFKICPVCLGIFSGPKHIINRRIFCSTNCAFKDRASGYKFSSKPPGGYRPGGGRGKSGWYKGYWCDSSYELAYVMYNLDHDIPFKRNDKGFSYTYNDSTHQYFPDFIEGNIFIEIKGYITDTDLAKFKYFPTTLKILYGSLIDPYLKYAKSVYGYNFTTKYDGRRTRT